MTISLQQFQSAFPDAAASTLAALFERDATLTTQLERILAEHGITEPESVVMFLAACSLLSKGFSDFDRDIYGVQVSDWLSARARGWHSSKLTELAREWEIEMVITKLSERFPIHGDWAAVWRALDAVCTGLGVKNKIEELAFDD